MIGWLPARYRALIQRAGWLSLIMLGFLPLEAALSAPYVPANDAQVLAQLPAGSVHTSSAVLERARTWLAQHARTVAAVILVLLAASLLRNGIADEA